MKPTLPTSGDPLKPAEPVPSSLLQQSSAILLKSSAEAAPSSQTTVEDWIAEAPWVEAFLNSPWLQETGAGEERCLLLMFLVCSSLLNRTNDLSLVHHILTTVKERFFADSEFWRSSLPLKDVRNAQDEIFRLFHVEGLNKSSTQLVSLLLSLEQDKAIRGALEPAYTQFLKSPRLHPHARVMEQCILSLL